MGRTEVLTLIVDSSALIAAADRDARQHGAVGTALQQEQEALVIPALVANEADYTILTRLGIDAELTFLDDLASGWFEVACLTDDELGAARDVAAAYRDLRVGLADASVVVLARRYGTRRLLTLDERDFRAMTPLQGGHFTILPADA